MSKKDDKKRRHLVKTRTTKLKRDAKLGICNFKMSDKCIYLFIYFVFGGCGRHLSGQVEITPGGQI